MAVSQIKEELHQFIDGADEITLVLLQDMIKHTYQNETLTVEQRQDLDKRVALHKNGESNSYSWAQARKMIEKQK